MDFETGALGASAQEQPPAEEAVLSRSIADRVRAFGLEYVEAPEIDLPSAEEIPFELFEAQAVTMKEAYGILRRWLERPLIIDAFTTHEERREARRAVAEQDPKVAQLMKQSKAGTNALTEALAHLELLALDAEDFSAAHAGQAAAGQLAADMKHNLQEEISFEEMHRAMRAGIEGSRDVLIPYVERKIEKALKAVVAYAAAAAAGGFAKAA
jgi:hypothetical protein